ncbi:MAG: hypothetical protein ACYSUQ_10420 [Planctomycetota bacterium]|jgi:hypothetical protein
MTKREAIDRIRKSNPSASPEFLAKFTPEELQAYLHQLESLQDRPQPTARSAAATSAQRCF